MVLSRFRVTLVAGLLLAASAARPQEQAPKEFYLPGVSLAIPSGNSIRPHWVCPPLDKAETQNLSVIHQGFAVDGEGRPWLDRDLQTLVCPVNRQLYQLSTPFESFTWLESGAFLVSTSSEIGFPVAADGPEKTKDGVPIMKFQPISQTPVPDCKLYAGAKECVYLVGGRYTTGEDAVYLLKPEKLPGSSKARARDFAKVYAGKEIAAVAGDGEVTYVATGKLILKINRSDGSVTREHQDTSAVQELAYSPNSGLFYATENSIGYIGPNGKAVLMATANPARIFLRKGTLYVFFPDWLGVLAIENAGNLRAANLDIKPVPSATTPEVRVSRIRLFESGPEPPDEAKRAYATEFARAQARYVFCELSLEAIEKGKEPPIQEVKVEMLPPGGEIDRDSRTAQVSFATGASAATACLGFGGETPGTLLPGRYALRAYLNGVKIDERGFTVTGDMTLMEAVRAKDSAYLLKLLEQGADPNTRNAENVTALRLAVDRQSTEIVKILLEHKADPNIARDGDATPLLAAAASLDTSPEIARMLLEHGADVQVKAEEGATFLHMAVMSNRLELVRMALDHGADVNARSKNGETPLCCIGARHSTDGSAREIAELLLSRGADPNAKNSNGMPVLVSAMLTDDPEIGRSVISHGADVNVLVEDPQTKTKHTILGLILNYYKTVPDPGVRRQMREFIKVLREKDATVPLDDGVNALKNGLDYLIDRKLIARILAKSDEAVGTYMPTDAELRKLVIKRLLEISSRKLLFVVKHEDYREPLNTCLTAKERVSDWGMRPQFPEVFLDCGLLWEKLGDPGNAVSDLGAYLELAPKAKDAGEIRRKIRDLEKQRKR